jgi:hypothetical protein
MKPRRKSKSEKLFTAVAGLMTVFLFVGLILLLFFARQLYGLFNNPFNDKRFSREVWLEHANSKDPDNPRGRMASDLRRRILRDGMSKEQVIEFLGEPDFSADDNAYKYNLGAWSGFRIDYDPFDVYFDESGVVARIEIVQH